ncbi:hypothetical protein C0Q70_18863 [Pomacea canaliculata]|uniref:GPI-anchor transamidase component GPAA1 n=1 Tax=Pomacea canaliculata TaxID=400727 RepID=A0A2T7NHR0_POMCA|nr:hypothetical protein C0Q70_18863 [Pomacea canaliculata]
MGLLTDTKQRQRLVSVLSRHHQKLSVLLYVVGLVWFLALAYEPLNASTYFSENALLPGLVDSNLPSEFFSLHQYAEALKAEMQKDKKRVPKDWIFRQFQNLGLETYRHNFTIKYPFKMAISQDLVGENIFAILRARRAASTEALVMATPLRAASTTKTQTDGGIAVMLGLAEQFRKNPYWAKDVIFLLSEFDEVGVHAWLDAYHETRSQYVIPDELPGRSGAIQAAINLEIPRDKIQYVNIKIEGLNGQLPNLDLFNLAVRLCRREQVLVTFHHRSDHYEADSWDSFQHSLVTMLHMMWSQASGAPSGGHGLFHRYHIEALTLEGVRFKKGFKNHPLEKIARVTEGIFRSLNNLLERFHQSFFFYLLPATDRYVSIGLYMPPFGLMVAAAAIKISFSLLHSKLFCMNSNEGKKCEKISGETTEGQHQSPGEETDGTQDVSLNEDSDDEFEVRKMTGLLTVTPMILVSFLLGLMAYTAPYILTRFTPSMKMKPDDTILFGILAVFSAALSYPYLMSRKAAPEDQLTVDWRLLQCVGLFMQGLVLMALSVMNISLAFFLAASSIPVTGFIKGTNQRVLRVLQLFALLVISPLGLLIIASLVNASLEKNFSGKLVDLVAGGYEHMKEMIFLLLVDQYLFSSWTYTIICFAILPTWLVFWAVPFNSP